jgi:hypothetical protein
MKPLHLLILAGLGWWLFRKPDQAELPAGYQDPKLGVIPTKPAPTVTETGGSGIDWEELAASSPT